MTRVICSYSDSVDVMGITRQRETTTRNEDRKRARTRHTARRRTFLFHKLAQMLQGSRSHTMVFWRLLLGTLLIYPVPLHARSRASLFEFVDQVTELSPSTFSDVAVSSVPWVLDCYSPGCPHCVRFAPTVSHLDLLLSLALGPQAPNMRRTWCMYLHELLRF